MRLLAVDTTSPQGSVAILEDDRLVAHFGARTARPKHAETLLPAIHNLLDEAELALADLDGFAVARGPGSFVGIRIGLATVAGLAYALDKPVVPVSSLDAAAHGHRRWVGTVVALLDAYRGEVYACAYDADGVRAVPRSEPSCETARAFLDRLDEPPRIVVGNASLSHREVIEDVFPSGVARETPGFFLAESVGRLGIDALESGASTPLSELDALYVRAPEAERKLAARSGRS